MSLQDEFIRLVEIIKRLRAPNGCPWDIEQTPLTMRESILEEAYEVVDALNETESNSKRSKNILHVKEELGDLLLNVLMVSYMFEQEGSFSITDVLYDISEKLIRRHPHVFGKTKGFEGPESNTKAKNSQDVLKQWDEIKENVENRKGEHILDSIPKSFPSVLRSYKIQKKVSKVGFDFDTVLEIWEKVFEELEELRLEIKSANLENEKINSQLIKNQNELSKSKIENELGDVLFSLVNLARVFKINPENALTSTNNKFEKRFRYIEDKMHQNYLKLSLTEKNIMNTLWEESKNEIE